MQTVIRSDLGLDDKYVGVQPDGRPPPVAGQMYVAIHAGPFQNQSDTSLDETYEARVTLSMRGPVVPTDRQGSDLVVLASTGLLARAEAIRASQHMNYTVLNNANTGQTYSIGAGENGFVEPLKFQSASEPIEVGADWWRSDKKMGGWMVALVFGGARRVQVIEEQS